jgi:hypothetical protein
MSFLDSFEFLIHKQRAFQLKKLCMEVTQFLLSDSCALLKDLKILNKIVATTPPKHVGVYSVDVKLQAFITISTGWSVR